MGKGQKLSLYLDKGFTREQALELLKLEAEQKFDDNNRIINNERAGILDYDTMDNLEEFDTWE